MNATKSVPKNALFSVIRKYGGNVISVVKLGKGHHVQRLGVTRKVGAESAKELRPVKNGANLHRGRMLQPFMLTPSS